MGAWRGMSGGSDNYEVWFSPASAAPGRRRTNVLLAVGAVLVVIALGAGVLIATGDPRVGDLLNGISITATPRPSARVPAASSAPATTRASQPPTSPDATALPGPAAAFASLAHKDGISYRVRVHVTIRSKSQTATMVMSGRQSGDDSAATVTLRLRGRSATAQVIEKDGAWYVKRANQSWTRSSGPPDQMSTLVSPGSVTSVEYLGVENHGGRRLNHVSANVEQTAQARATLSGLGCDLDDAVADYWVRDDGTPVAAEFGYECDDGSDHWVVSASFSFSRFGQPTEIKAPAQFR